MLPVQNALSGQTRQEKSSERVVAQSRETSHMKHLMAGAAVLVCGTIMAPGVASAQNLTVDNNSTETAAAGVTTYTDVYVGYNSGTVGGAPGGTYVVSEGSDIQFTAAATGPGIWVGAGANSSGLLRVDGTISSPANFVPGTLVNLVAGNAAGSFGTVNISSTGSMNLANMMIGSAAGSVGVVNVDGGSITSVNPQSQYYIGVNGQGTLSITNGGQVTSLSQTYLGYNPGSVGTLTVDGPGSSYTGAAGAEPGVFIVGNQGEGHLIVTNGGSVGNVGMTLQIGGSSVGTALVSGAGSNIFSGTYFGVGVSAGGDGALTITDGATASAPLGTYMAWDNNTTASIVVSGTGSLTSGALVVGAYGTADLQVQANSSATITGPTIVGAVEGSGSVEVTGVGASLAVQNGDLTVGGAANGTMTISGGGNVNVTGGSTFISGQCYASSGLLSYICASPVQGGQGAVTVTDAGSVLNAGDTLGIGQFGVGSLTIANNGRVLAASGVTIAQDAASTGVLNIGAAAGQAATAPGFLNTPTVTFGAGMGDVVFNHTSSNYEFAPVMTGGSATTSSVDVYSGTTVMTGVGSDYFGRTTVYGGAALAAGAANVFSPNSDYVVQGGATLDLRGTSQTVGTMANAGLINMGTGTMPGTILTVNGNYVGNGGIIALNTYLGDDSSPTDRLVVNGSTSGSTGLRIVNAGGLGALTTGNGIEVVQVNGTSNGQFGLTGRVAAGAYDYNLFQGGVGTDASNGNWYLRSETAATPGGPATPSVRPEVPTDTAAPAMAAKLGIVMLGTYFERSGTIVNRVDENGNIVNGYADPSNSYASIFDGNMNAGGAARYCADSVEEPKSGLYAKHQPVPCNALMWGRVFGETGNSGSTGSAYSFGYGGFQAGMDIYHTMRDNVGLFVGVATMQSNVLGSAGQAAGHVGMDAYGFGGYWTRRVGGWYSDLVLQGNWYDDIRAVSVLGQTFATQGWGLTASAETGYAVRLGGGYSLIPQAQIVYQRTDIRDGADQFALISFGATDEVYGRLGTRFTKGWLTNDGRTVTTWADVNVWHQFTDDANTTFANLQGAFPTTMSASLGGTWAEFALGVSGPVMRNVNVFGTVGYNVALSQPGYSVTGRTGLRIAW